MGDLLVGFQSKKKPPYWKGGLTGDDFQMDRAEKIVYEVITTSRNSLSVKFSCSSRASFSLTGKGSSRFSLPRASLTSSRLPLFLRDDQSYRSGLPHVMRACRKHTHDVMLGEQGDDHSGILGPLGLVH